MKNRREKKYSVRVSGCTSWMDTDSLDRARKQAKIADRVCRPGHVVVDNETGEIVQDEDLDREWC